MPEIFNFFGYRFLFSSEEREREILHGIHQLAKEYASVAF